MEKKYVNPKFPKKAKPIVASAGMRREILYKNSRVYVPTEESVVEAKEWVETHQE